MITKIFIIVANISFHSHNPTYLITMLQKATQKQTQAMQFN